MSRLMRAMLWSILVFGGAMWAQAQTPPPGNEARAEGAARFIAVDVFVDSGASELAAYQFEFSGPESVTIVGVEGGESKAFANAPYYDPEALMKGRIIVAAFTTGEELPTGKTRVARLHLRVAGEPVPEFAVQLTVAGDADGKPIKATASTAPSK